MTQNPSASISINAAVSSLSTPLAQPINHPPLFFFFSLLGCGKPPLSSLLLIFPEAAAFWHDEYYLGIYTYGSL
jgi:hypothetical protein